MGFGNQSYSPLDQMFVEWKSRKRAELRHWCWLIAAMFLLVAISLSLRWFQLDDSDAASRAGTVALTKITVGKAFVALAAFGVLFTAANLGSLVAMQAAYSRVPAHQLWAQVQLKTLVESSGRHVVPISLIVVVPFFLVAILANDIVGVFSYLGYAIVLCVCALVCRTMVIVRNNMEQLGLSARRAFAGPMLQEFVLGIAMFIAVFSAGLPMVVSKAIIPLNTSMFVAVRGELESTIIANGASQVVQQRLYSFDLETAPSRMYSPDRSFWDASVTAEKLNVRSKPNRESDVLSQLSRGENVRVLSKDGSWRLVARGTRLGWVYSGYLSEEEHLDMVAWGGESLFRLGVIVGAIGLLVPTFLAFLGGGLLSSLLSSAAVTVLTDGLVDTLLSWKIVNNQPQLASILIGTLLAMALPTFVIARRES